MAHLITDHDPFHVHKLLGLFCLLHFLFRLLNLTLHGTAFPESESTAVQVGCVLAHGLLSWSSLLLPLPAKRNYSSPMIWPEFRFHSIGFVSRHVVATALTLADAWPKEPLYEAAAKMAVVVATVLAARHITARHGSKEKRTTNAMPYPPAVGPKEQAGVKVNYTMAQFHATMHSIMGDPTAAFLPLLGLQLAPFLMTLVRKGIASSFTYHRVYAVALYLPYAAMMYRLVINAFGFYEMMWFGFVTILAKRIRLSLRVPAEVCWGVGVPLAVLGKPHVLGLVTETALANRVGTLVFILHTNIKIAERYWPLF